jgi:nucleoside-diphosphate kinase
MQRLTNDTRVRYILAVIAPGLALLLSLAFWPAGTGNPLAIPVFLASVVVCALVGGLGPGLLTTALSFLAIDYFFEEPMYSLMITSVGTAVDLMTFALVAVLVSVVSARSRAVRPLGRAPSPRVAELAASTAPRLARGPVFELPQSVELQERTLIIVKPDGVRRSLVGEVIRRLERRGFRLLGLKVTRLGRPFAEDYYSRHRGLPFFDELVDYIMSGPIVVMVLECEGAIPVVRAMVGSPEPERAIPGTIRGDFARTRLRTVVHASDSPEAAREEIDLWFKPEELANGSAPLSVVPRDLVPTAKRPSANRHTLPLASSL